MDTKANTYGKLLLELCKNTGLIIANGIIYQDKHRGSFTYYNRNGKSVIDYMLFDPNCYNMITDFAVAPKLVESAHCPIEFGLEIEPLCNTHKSVKDDDHVAVYKAYHKYIWNVSRTDQYKISLRRDECNNIIYQLILNANTDRSSDYICSLIHKLITTASSGILKKVNINKNNSSMKQMPTNAWFDSECNELRKTINTYAKRSNLTHTENNNYYHNLCNNYKRMIQRKKRNYNTKLKVNLEEMCSNNPKDYWCFWKRLQRQNLSESTIELYQFYNCFLKQSEPPTGQNANTKFKTIQQKYLLIDIITTYRMTFSMVKFNWTK